MRYLVGLIRLPDNSSLGNFNFCIETVHEKRFPTLRRQWITHGMVSGTEMSRHWIKYLNQYFPTKGVLSCLKSMESKTYSTSKHFDNTFVRLSINWVAGELQWGGKHLEKDYFLIVLCSILATWKIPSSSQNLKIFYSLSGIPTLVSLDVLLLHFIVL